MRGTHAQLIDRNVGNAIDKQIFCFPNRTTFGNSIIAVAGIQCMVAGGFWIDKTDVAAAVFSLLTCAWIFCRFKNWVSHPVLAAAISASFLIAGWVINDHHTAPTGFRIPFECVLLSVLVILWNDLTAVYACWMTDSARRHVWKASIQKSALKWITFGCLGVLLIYGVVVPIIAELLHAGQPTTPQQLDRLTLAGAINFNICETMAAVFFFTIGACVGSFLNVVIFRIPQRVSVLVKPSYCPNCEYKIGGTDNLPLIGWLRLKGQCRNCDIKISSRYPTVELVVGLAFLALYFVELISGGKNLPHRTVNFHAGVQWVLFYTKWDLVNLYIYHCLILCTVFSWAMMRRDNNQVPTTSFLIMFAFVVVPPLLSPHLYPLHAFPKRFANQSTWYDSLITVSLGLVAATIAVGLLHLVARTKSFQRLPIHLPSWILLGAGLGWQAVIGIFLFSIAWLLLEKIHPRMFQSHCSSNQANSAQPKPEINWLLLPWIALVHHLIWRQLPLWFTSQS